MRSKALGFVLLSVVLSVPAIADAPPTLSFADRVAAQAEIQRVYHAHRIGETRSFENAVPMRSQASS